MTGEECLLLLLARRTFDSETAERARALATRSIEWSRVLDLAETHGVTPLVAANVAGSDGLGSPAEIRSALDRARRFNSAKNLLAARLLGGVLASLGEIGVPAIPLKGVALAESLYGDPGARASSDVDVLLRVGDVRRAIERFAAEGYARGAAEPDVGAQDFDLLIESNIEYVFAPQEWSGCPVELHWDIAWRWARDARAIDDLWAEARPGRFRGAVAWRLSPEWELIYLAVHAARHRWERLKWLVDVHEICVRGEVNWPDARARADRFGLGGALDTTLAVCRTLLDTPVPPGAAVGRLPPWLAVFPSRPEALGVWSGAAYPARLFGRPSDKIRYLWRVLFRPTLAERRLVRLPAALRPLYYPLRPLRLAGKWSAGLVRGGLRRLETEPERAPRS